MLVRRPQDSSLVALAFAALAFAAAFAAAPPGL